LLTQRLRYVPSVSWGSVQGRLHRTIGINVGSPLHSSNGGWSGRLNRHQQARNRVNTLQDGGYPPTLRTVALYSVQIQTMPRGGEICARLATAGDLNGNHFSRTERGAA
jgi:hypothetical protein